MTSVDRRRELNRLAAQKLRNRQKEKAVTVKQVWTKYICWVVVSAIANINWLDKLQSLIELYTGEHQPCMLSSILVLMVKGQGGVYLLLFNP